jgi:hypothetical protein
MKSLMKSTGKWNYLKLKLQRVHQKLQCELQDSEIQEELQIKIRTNSIKLGHIRRSIKRNGARRLRHIRMK